jgi:hypothetical protein
MPTPVSASPDSMPILSRGKHRNSRKGACFMEMASVLAGEKWSDHPRCTHPLLADLARHVNDATSDDNRHELALLIPEVVGLTSDDPRVDARIALRCATTALPVASEERQNVLAVSVLSADCVLAHLDGRQSDDLEPASQAALDTAPRAAEWARSFVRRAGVAVKGYKRHGAPGTVRLSVHGVAEACIDDPDAILRQLLIDAIADTAALCRPETAIPASRTAPSTSAPAQA